MESGESDSFHFPLSTSHSAAADSQGHSAAPLTVEKPEDIRLLDPACGSGHMLTYAFDLLVKIYEEEGHAPSEIPEKILTHNLFGLEICPRAAQLAQFALVCKARSVDRRFFRRFDAGVRGQGSGVSEGEIGVRGQGSGVSVGSRPRIMCLRDVVMTPDEVKAFADATGIQFSENELTQIHQFRENTPTFGALIQPVLNVEQLDVLKSKLHPSTFNLHPSEGDLLIAHTHRKLRLVLDQAEMLSQRYQVVVANPPYMSNRTMTAPLRRFAEDRFNYCKLDLFAMFIDRSFSSSVKSGYVALIAMQSWMFLSSYEKMRTRILSNHAILTMAHLGAGAFDSLSGEVVQTAAFVAARESDPERPGLFLRLVEYRGEKGKDAALIQNVRELNRDVAYSVSPLEIAAIPGATMAYWLPKQLRAAFSKHPRLQEVAETRKGMVTARNDIFTRNWYEVEKACSALDKHASRESAKKSPGKWFSYIKGGGSRKWYGNKLTVVNWFNDGHTLRTTKHPTENRIWATNFNLDYIFKPNVHWGDISTGTFTARLSLGGEIFDATGLACFPQSGDRLRVLGFLNSRITADTLKGLNPTLHFQAGNIANLPFHVSAEIRESLDGIVESAIDLARTDWDNFETSWDFRDFPLLRDGKSGDRIQGSGVSKESETDPCPLLPDPCAAALKGPTLEASWRNWAAHCTAAIRRMQELETGNNRLWIDAYGLQDELDPAVPEDEITLARADQRKDIAAFLSYAVGCMMGRYSLGAPGLICANAGDTVEDYLRIVAEKRADTGVRGQGAGVRKQNSGSKIEGTGNSENDPPQAAENTDPCPLTPDPLKFPPDQDAIIPLLDGEWFQDDVVARTREFLRVTFGDDTLEENLRFIEESLGKDLRKYFLTDFYKDHLQTYKKRPIYWLFQSPKKGFGALVYLHRYTRDTVNTLLNDYLRDFLKKLESRIEHLEHVQDTAGSAREKTAATKEADKLRKTLKECREWERDILLPLAQQRLEIDLDDGVKANYPKFGKALASIPGLSKNK